MNRLLEKYLFFKSGVFISFLPLVIRAECIDWQIEFTCMMYCMFQDFLLDNHNFYFRYITNLRFI